MKKIKTNFNMQKNAHLPEAGDFIHHGLYTTRNPTVYGPGYMPGVKITLLLVGPTGSVHEH